MSVVLVRHIFETYKDGEWPGLLARRAFAWAAVVVIASALLPFSPKHTDFTRAMTSNAEKVRHVVFGERVRGTQTLALSKYPHVLYGVVDAICRGGANIFVEYRSSGIDALFGDDEGGGFTCLGVSVYPGFVPDDEVRLVFRVEADEDLDRSLDKYREAYPVLARYRVHCTEPDYVLSDGARLTQCLGTLDESA